METVYNRGHPNLWVKIKLFFKKIFKRRKPMAEDKKTVDEEEIDKAKDDVKAGGEQTEKDKVDESVGDQEKKSGEDSQDAKDRVDESEGEKKADDKKDDKKSDNDKGDMKNSPDDKKTLSEVETLTKEVKNLTELVGTLVQEMRGANMKGENGEVDEAKTEEEELPKKEEIKENDIDSLWKREKQASTSRLIY